MQKGITQLSRWQQPLRGADDVAAVNLGAKTQEKILEIMQSGRLERNAVRAADPVLQVRFLLRALLLASRGGSQSRPVLSYVSLQPQACKQAIIHQRRHLTSTSAGICLSDADCVCVMCRQRRNSSTCGAAAMRQQSGGIKMAAGVLD